MIAADDAIDRSRWRKKRSPEDADYQDKVAKPIMAAIDAMPAEYRALVHEFDYVPVYHAHRRGWSVARIRDLGEAGELERALFG